MTNEQIEGLATEHGTRYVNRHVDGNASFGFMRDGLYAFARAIAALSAGCEEGKARVQRKAPVSHRVSVRAKLGAEIIGFSETAFWLRHKNDPTFPSAYKVGPKTTLWYEDELVEWRDKHRTAKGKA